MAPWQATGIWPPELTSGWGWSAAERRGLDIRIAVINARPYESVHISWSKVLRYNDRMTEIWGRECYWSAIWHPCLCMHEDFLERKCTVGKWIWMGNKIRSPCSAVTCVSVKSKLKPISFQRIHGTLSRLRSPGQKSTDSTANEGISTVDTRMMWPFVMFCGNTLDPVDNGREPTYTNIGIMCCVHFA